jgi:hypothetical protein
MKKTSRACAAAALWRMRRAASIRALTPTATRPHKTVGVDLDAVLEAYDVLGWLR